MQALLEVNTITKAFGGTAALSGCTLSCSRGEVTGIIGPNGAGKTTLLNVMTGVERPDTGRVVFDGTDVTGVPLHGMAARGLVRTFQIVRDLGTLTVLENLLLAFPAQTGESVLGSLVARARVRMQERKNAATARDMLQRIGLWHLADAPAAILSGGQKKLLDLTRAMLLEPRMILLDEPAAGVSPPLLEEIIALIMVLKRQGVSFCIVEHDMRLIDEVCDYVHVLAEGRVLTSGTFAEVTADRRVIDAYLGVAA